MISRPVEGKLLAVNEASSIIIIFNLAIYERTVALLIATVLGWWVGWQAGCTPTSTKRQPAGL
jgi:hypothetical protein